MPIKAIELENFKGISSRARIELKPITLLFGPNSAGKSTILQALHYAREILARRNTDPDRTQYGGDRIDLGGFRNLVHNHDYSLPVMLSFDLDLNGLDLIDYMPLMLEQPKESISLARLEELSGLVQSATVALVVKWSAVSQEPVQADYQVGINGEWIARIRTNPESPTQHVVEYNALHRWLSGEDRWREAQEDAQLRMAENLMLDKRESWEELQQSWQKEEWTELNVSPINSPQRLYVTYQSLIDEIRAVLSSYDSEGVEAEITFALLAAGNYLLRELNSLRYLGPIREVPDRGHRPALSPDDSRWASGIGAWDWIHQASQEQRDRLNEWLAANHRLATGYQIEVKRFKEIDAAGPLMVSLLDPTAMLDSVEALRSALLALPEKTRLMLTHGDGHLEVSPQDIGIGISQVIPVIVATLDGADRLTAIEQPELHIHPALQIALGDLFISAVRAQDDAATYTAFLLETHSEHLLLRMLRRLRESSEGEAPRGLSLTVDQIAVYFVEGTTDGTTIRRLVLDERGNFSDRWPRGFFDEREKELFGDAQPMSDADFARMLGQ